MPAQWSCMEEMSWHVNEASLMLMRACLSRSLQPNSRLSIWPLCSLLFLRHMYSLTLGMELLFLLTKFILHPNWVLSLDTQIRHSHRIKQMSFKLSILRSLQGVKNTQGNWSSEQKRLFVLSIGFLLPQRLPSVRVNDAVDKYLPIMRLNKPQSLTLEENGKR